MVIRVGFCVCVVCAIIGHVDTTQVMSRGKSAPGPFATSPVKPLRHNPKAPFTRGQVHEGWCTFCVQSCGMMVRVCRGAAGASRREEGTGGERGIRVYVLVC